MLAVVLAGRRASGRALVDGEDAFLEDLHAHVGVAVVAVEEGVDGGVAEGASGGVAGGRGDGVVHVAVGAGDDDVEVVAPLADVGCGGGGDGAAVVDAFDYGGGGWVRAVCSRLLAWVAFWGEELAGCWVWMLR